MPGLYLCGFFTPPVAGALFRAALVANCFLGALPPVDFLAVCLVLAILLDSECDKNCSRHPIYAVENVQARDWLNYNVRASTVKRIEKLTNQICFLIGTLEITTVYNESLMRERS